MLRTFSRRKSFRSSRGCLYGEGGSPCTIRADMKRFPFLTSWSEKNKSSSNLDDKKLYLLPENLTILPMVVGRLHDISRLPPKSNRNEWLATNCIQFFNQINVQYGAVSEMCTKDLCPVMCAGPNVYEWQDGKTGRKQKLPARQYVDTAMSFVQKNMQDDTTFPTKFGHEFPADFEQILKKIFRIYFSILAHVYLHHYRDVVRVGANDLLNSLFLHFVYFNQEFSLLEHNDFAILEDLMKNLIRKDAELVQWQKESGEAPEGFS